MRHGTLISHSLALPKIHHREVLFSPEDIREVSAGMIDRPVSVFRIVFVLFIFPNKL